jgi:hypothetical protein
MHKEVAYIYVEHLEHRLAPIGSRSN